MKLNVYIRMFCYPTEDLEKNKEIFRLLDIEPEIEEVPEAFGLPMYIFSKRLERQREVLRFFQNLLKFIPKERLFEILKENFDPKSNTIYLRIDKQEFFKNRKLRFVSHGDVLHIKLKLVRPQNIDELIEELSKKL